ncbi:cytochrome P450 [Lentzea atacamensis]|uniref:Cytochrome P450 n=1 Tax=Lentzea atacamensis TaxID=531938 RepID=A0ABX9EC23_9PSEU|nr:cytochrome P450 [Lentzea atacamensis]RAS67443.1 cytochrome P450 [Lentzea atacamensis]
MADNRLTPAIELPEVLGGIDLADPSGFTGGVPYELFARLRREAPVVFHPCGPDPANGFWVLTRHADIVAAASDPAFSAEGGGTRRGGGTHLEDLPAGQPTGAVLFMMDDPRHELIKRALRPFLTGPAVETLLHELRARAVELVNRAVASGVLDVVSAVAEPFALHAICALLGVPHQDRALLTGWLRAVVGFTDRRTGRVDDHSRATFDAMRRYFQRKVSKKHACPVRDLGGAIAAGDVPGGRPLSTVEQEAHALVLFVSGYEQVRNTTAAAVAAFAEHPGQWRLLRDDRSLLGSAVEEVLRWAPPNPYNRRTACTDVIVAGQHIRAGDKVTFWWPAANRDPEVVRDPDVFAIRRNPNPHVAFGAGSHLCAGAELSRALLRLVLTSLLDQVEQIQPAGPVVFSPNNKHTVPLSVPVELNGKVT